MIKPSSYYFTTNDGAKLHYLEVGKGEPLLMLPGGGFSAEIFNYQLDILSQHYRVLVLDKRGHGKSNNIDFGYCVARFAKDIDDLFNHLNLKHVNVLGHSLGAAVIYKYIDLFSTARLKKFIVIDEPPALLINPLWSEQERLQYGAIYEASKLYELTNGFLAADISALKQNIVEAMTTKNITADKKTFIFNCLDLPGQFASQLYFNNICQDFRKVINKINIPTLFVTGKASLHPWQSHQWMQQQVPDSKLALFSEAEGGNHFLFVENPEKFNALALKFLAT